MEEPRPSLPPRYAISELLAHGGMGDVYRATDQRLGRIVAVKLLADRHARNDEFRVRFVREAQTAASLTGEPFVAAIYDVGETEDGLPFIVMEYVSEGTVADRIRNGPIERAQATTWLRQAAAAVDAAHARGIVHRDVKPANLLVAEDGAIRVSDFGIARAAGHDTLTLAGTVLGSSGYMAPEQARGEPSTPATDRYALACIAFELLTGSRPFARESVAAEAAAHANEPPPSAAARGLPSHVDRVFARGLAKRPDERYPTCGAFVADLRDALATPDTTTAVPTAVPVSTTATRAVPVSTTATRIARHGSRPRRGAALLGAAALVGLGAIVAWAVVALGDGSDPSMVVVTRTLQGQTVERTVTVEGETVVRTEAAPPQEDPSSLNDRGFRLLQQGDAQGALPLLESAVSQLSGSSSITEAYASYNLALARFTLGNCDGVAELLARSEDVQGERKEIDRLRKQVERRCEEGSD
jgi:eukaryotic-like serine/threonine-protein kinase